MSKLNGRSNRIVSFRKFDNLDSNTYVSYEFAWPVEVIECYANKVSEGVLDTLSETVLELVSIQDMTRKKMSEFLLISDEILVKILKSLEAENFYNYDKKIITEGGVKYLNDKASGVFQEEKVFGNMFVSKIDRGVLPYFYEGQLPWSRKEEDLLILSYDQSEVIEDGIFLDKINRAYHKYGMIYRGSKELEENADYQYSPDFFIESELLDQSYDEEDTLADKERNKVRRELKNARIKVLKTPRKEIYVKARLCVSKAAPDKYCIDSPFERNKTNWYSDCFKRMVAENELIYIEDGNEIGLEYFCEDITNQFYVDYPEMQRSNFEQFIKMSYPNMNTLSFANDCKEKYYELFNLNLIYNDAKVKESVVITESTKALEMILNNYIAKTDKTKVVRRYEQIVNGKEDVYDLMMQYNISDCIAINKELRSIPSYNNNKIQRKLSIMNSFKYYCGTSVVDKYYYLIAESIYNSESNCRKLFSQEGIRIVKLLDNINQIRNQYGAHNDGTNSVKVSAEKFSAFQEAFKEATNILINYVD